MKNLFLLLITIGLFSSCVENPTEDPDPVPPPGNVTATFDGGGFTSTTTQAVITSNSMSIKASQEDGSYFKITLPESPIVGTYTWSVYDVGSPGFYMAYFEGPDADPYVAARDNVGEFAPFPAYVDTAQLIITWIDTVNKRIYGYFSFTGVRFTDDTQTAIETKVFSNGVINSIPYTSSPTFDPDDDDNIFPQRIVYSYPGTTISDASTVFTYEGSKIKKFIYTDSDGSVETVEFTYTGNFITKKETKMNNVVKAREIFGYDSGKLTTYISASLETSTAIREVYVHNSDGSISVSRFTGDLTTQSTPDGTSTISFDNGEVSQISFSSGIVKSYTYDEEKNAFKNVVGFDKISFVDGEAEGILKNVVSESIGAVPTFEFFYTYTPYNFPLKATSDEVEVDYYYE